MANRQLQVPANPQHLQRANDARLIGSASAVARLANELAQAEHVIASLEVALETALDRAEKAEKQLPKKEDQAPPKKRGK